MRFPCLAVWRALKMEERRFLVAQGCKGWSGCCGAAINCHKSLHKITNCISGLARQPRICSFHRRCRVFLSRFFFVVFPGNLRFLRRCFTTVWSPRNPPSWLVLFFFLFVEFYGSQIKFALQFAFWGRFGLFSFLWGPEWKWKRMSCVSRVGVLRIRMCTHMSVHVCVAYGICVCAPPGAAYRTNCVAKVRIRLLNSWTAKLLSPMNWRPGELPTFALPRISPPAFPGRKPG